MRRSCAAQDRGVQSEVGNRGAARLSYSAGRCPAVRATDPKAGLDRDTKFDLGKSVRLPFDREWFAPSPNGCFGDHPKRGILNLKGEKLKRALQAAILEARKAGRL